jgi:hypothetical protein
VTSSAWSGDRPCFPVHADRKDASRIPTTLLPSQAGEWFSMALPWINPTKTFSGTRIHGTTKRQVVAMFAEERSPFAVLVSSDSRL